LLLSQSHVKDHPLFQTPKSFFNFQISDLKKKNLCKKEKKTQNKLHKLQASYIHVGIFILQRKNHVGKGCRRKIPENTICIFLAKTGFYFAKTFYGKVNFCVFFAFFRVFTSICVVISPTSM